MECPPATVPRPATRVVRQNKATRQRHSLSHTKALFVSGGCRQVLAYEHSGRTDVYNDTAAQDASGDVEMSEPIASTSTSSEPTYPVILRATDGNSNKKLKVKLSTIVSPAVVASRMVYAKVSRNRFNQTKQTSFMSSTVHYYVLAWRNQ